MNAHKTTLLNVIQSCVDQPKPDTALKLHLVLSIPADAAKEDLYHDDRRDFSQWTIISVDTVH